MLKPLGNALTLLITASLFWANCIQFQHIIHTTHTLTKTPACYHIN